MFFFKINKSAQKGMLAMKCRFQWSLLEYNIHDQLGLPLLMGIEKGGGVFNKTKENQVGMLNKPPN